MGVPVLFFTGMWGIVSRILSVLLLALLPRCAEDVCKCRGVILKLIMSLKTPGPRSGEANIMVTGS